MHANLGSCIPKYVRPGEKHFIIDGHNKIRITDIHIISGHNKRTRPPLSNASIFISKKITSLIYSYSQNGK